MVKSNAAALQGLGGTPRGGGPFLGHTHSALTGELQLEGLRINQLTLARRLAGTLELKQGGVRVVTKGRPDEHFNIEVSVDMMTSKP